MNRRLPAIVQNAYSPPPGEDPYYQPAITALTKYEQEMIIRKQTLLKQRLKNVKAVVDTSAPRYFNAAQATHMYSSYMSPMSISVRSSPHKKSNGAIRY